MPISWQSYALRDGKLIALAYKNNFKKTIYTII